MKIFRRKLLVQGLALGAGLAVSLGMMSAALAEFQPQKPITFVVMAGKGGGADKAVRLMQSIIAKEKYAPVPVTPINKPGGSGAEALVYMNGKKGDNHTIMFTLNSFYTTPLRQPGLNIDVLKFAPIARMAEDTFVLWVHKDSGIKNINEFVKAAKAKGDNWTMAGTGKGQEDQLLTEFLNKAYGLKMKYVPFKGGGAVAKQLAGKHVGSTVNNPSEALGFQQAGVVVPIAAFTPQRLPLVPNTPTFSELGKSGMDYFMQRSVVGAPGMSKGAQQYYQGLFQKVYNSAEWQSYMKKKSLQGEFLTGNGLMKYWKKGRTAHRKMLKDIGEI